MSRAGAAEGGFTLIELLVVLTLVALLAGLAAPRLGTLLQPSLDRTTRKVALAVRDDRTAAMLSGRMVTVSTSRLSQMLPAGMALEQTAPEKEPILFFPDGTSTGGRLLVGGRGDQRGIDIDWLTGRVSVAR
ncbi:MAG: prepilin-type N-terminal cleavage/methylation domain-containing protein [Geminicoccaceae bacterium]